LAGAASDPIASPPPNELKFSGRPAQSRAGRASEAKDIKAQLERPTGERLIGFGAAKVWSRKGKRKCKRNG